MPEDKKAQKAKAEAEKAKAKELDKIVKEAQLFSGDVGIAGKVNSLINSSISLGTTKEQLVSTIEKYPGSAKLNFASICKKKGSGVPQNYQIKEFSKAEQDEREAVSKKAIANFVSASYDTLALDFKESVVRGDLSQEDYQSFKTSRDIMQVLLRRGSGEDVYKQNLETVKMFLGKNLDAEKLGKEEFKKQRGKQIAKLFNDRMREILDNDFDQFGAMSDKELVERWPEYIAINHPVSIILKELDSLKSTGIELDENLCSLIRENSDKYQVQYYSNNERMHEIMMPYYSKIDAEAAFNCSSKEKNQLVQIAESTDDLGLIAYLQNANSLLDSKQMNLIEGIQSKIGEKAGTGPNDKYVFFDAAGNKIADPYSTVYKDIKNGGVIFAGPENDSKNLLAFSLNDNGALTAPQPGQYKDVMDKISSGMPVKTDRTEELYQKIKSVDKSIESFRTSSFSVRESMLTLKNSILRTENPVQTRQDVTDWFVSLQSKKNPPFGRDDFYNAIGAKGSERLCKEKTEERRLLTMAATKATIDYDLEMGIGTSLVSGKSMNGVVPRAFTFFFLKPGEANKDANLKLYNRFFGLDDKGNSLNLSKDELNKTRFDMIDARLKEYNKMGEELGGKTYSDKDIVDNYAKMAEYGIGMGMEWDNIVSAMQELGIEATDQWKNDAKAQQKKAYYINNAILNRVQYISCQHYQFGAEKQLASMQSYAALLATGESGVQKSANWAFNCKSNVGNEITSLIKDDPRFAADKASFAVDQNGKIIKAPATDDMKKYNAFIEALSESLNEGNTLTLVGKDGSISGAVDFTQVGKFPPSLNEYEITPQLSAQARFAVYEDKLAGIKNSKLSPARKELLEDIAGSEYELGSIADAYYKAVKGGNEKQSALAKSSLKRSLKTYIARLAVSKKLDFVDSAMDRNAEDQLTSAESIKLIEKSIGLTPAVDRMLDKLIASENPMSFLNSKDVFREFASEQVKADKEIAEKKKESSMKSEKALNVFATSGFVRNKFSWGLTPLMVKTAENSSRIHYSFTRSMLQTLAFGMMVNDGVSFDDICDPYNQAQREKYMNDALKLVNENKDQEVLESLVGGMEKCGEFMEAEYKRIGEMTYEKYISDDCRMLRNLQVFSQDFLQESTRVLREIEEEQKAFTKENPNLPVPENIKGIDADRYKKASVAMTGYAMRSLPYSESVGVICGDLYSGMGPEKAGNLNFGRMLHSMALIKFRRMVINAPENAGKSVPEILCNEMQRTNEMLITGIISCPAGQAISSKVLNDKAFCEKLAIAALDGSFEENFDVKFSFDKEGYVSCDFDADKLIKHIEGKSVDRSLFKGVKFESLAAGVQMQKALGTSLSDEELDTRARNIYPGLAQFDKNGKNMKESLANVTDAIIGSEDPKEALDIVTLWFEDRLAPKKTRFSKEEYYDELGMNEDEQLSDRQIEDRRELSLKAVRVILKDSVERQIAHKDVPEVKGSILAPRFFYSFFCKRGSENAAENLARYQKFYGLDKDNNPLDLTKDQLNANRLELIKDRVEEYRKLVSKYEGKSFSDKDIIDNFSELNELGLGMGLEWQNIRTAMVKSGIEPDEKWMKDANALNNSAYYLNNVILGRSVYIASPHYQYGGEEKLDTPEKIFPLMKKGDMYLAKSASGIITRVTQLSNEINDMVKDDPRFAPDKVSYIVSDKGKIIKPGSDEIGMSLQGGGTLTLVDGEGKITSVVDFKDPFRFPAKINEQNVANLDIAEQRFNAYKGKLDNIKAMGLSPAKADLLEDIAGSEYEIGSIAEAYYKAAAGNDEKQTEMYKNSLKRAMTTYITRVTISKKLESVDSKVGKDMEAELTSKKHLKQYEKTLGASPAVEKLVDRLIESKNNMCFLKSEDVFKAFSAQQKIVNEEMAKESKIREAEPEISQDIVVQNK